MKCEAKGTLQYGKVERTQGPDAGECRPCIFEDGCCIVCCDHCRGAHLPSEAAIKKQRWMEEKKEREEAAALAEQAQQGGTARPRFGWRRLFGLQ